MVEAMEVLEMYCDLLLARQVQYGTVPSWIIFRIKLSRPLKRLSHEMDLAFDDVYG